MRPARRYCGLSVETGSFISVKSLTTNSALNVRVQRVVLGGIEQDDWRFNLEAIEQGLV